MIRTTHTGSMPRPAALTALLLERDHGRPAPGIEAEIGRATEEIVRRQSGIGIDVLNDGEMGKISYVSYVKDRLTGFEGESVFVSRRRPELDDHPDFAERWRALVGEANPHTPACVGDVKLKDRAAIHADIANLTRAAALAGIPADRLFMTAASPGVIVHFFANQHYGSREAFLAALAEAMRAEYEAIAAAGITLQIDCPDLAMSRHSVFADVPLAEFKRQAALNVEALNEAVKNIPAERMRFHVCWGNYDGPHDYDVPLAQITDVILRAKPAGIVLESSNPRHGHEWRVWEATMLPADKYIVAGVVDTTNNYVEHPELVAQRLTSFARVVGPERVMAGSDCGFGTMVMKRPVVAPTVTWSKLGSLVEGARLASLELDL